MQNMNARKSAVTDPYPKAREAYDKGAGLRAIKRTLHLNDGEMRDVAPDEYEDEEHATPEGNGGY